MRKLFLVLISVLCLGTAALAQGDDASATVNVDDVVTENYWAGVSFGYPGVSGHFGLKDVFGAADVRANLGFYYIGGAAVLGVDALFDINLNIDAPLSLYAGGGPLIFVGNDFGAGLEGLVGVEYRLSDFDFNSGAVFFELGPLLRFGLNDPFTVIGRLGFNYYF